MSPRAKAELAPGARGFDLIQLLAGRRKGDKVAPRIYPARIAAAGGPPESVMSRLLRGQGEISDDSLRALADAIDALDREAGLDPPGFEEVHRAYTMFVRRVIRGGQTA